MSNSSSGEIRVDRWPSERPLFALVLIVSVALWMLAVITIVGVNYSAVLGLSFFVIHLAFVAHVRGNGVRIGPGQFPEVYESIERLAHRIGLTTAPEVYLIQGGGMLNAMVTRFAFRCALWLGRPDTIRSKFAKEVHLWRVTMLADRRIGGNWSGTTALPTPCPIVSSYD